MCPVVVSWTRFVYELGLHAISSHSFLTFIIPHVLVQFHMHHAPNVTIVYYVEEYKGCHYVNHQTFVCPGHHTIMLSKQMCLYKDVQ